LIRANAEKIKIVLARIFARIPPLSCSTISQMTISVNAPNNAGKKRTQNTLPPNRLISKETQEVKGGTEIYPAAR